MVLHGFTLQSLHSASHRSPRYRVMDQCNHLINIHFEGCYLEGFNPKRPQAAPGQFRSPQPLGTGLAKRITYHHKVFNGLKLGEQEHIPNSNLKKWPKWIMNFRPVETNPSHGPPVCCCRFCHTSVIYMGSSGPVAKLTSLDHTDNWTKMLFNCSGFHWISPRFQKKPSENKEP